jgi:hypothetical protein
VMEEIRQSFDTPMQEIDELLLQRRMIAVSEYGKDSIHEEILAAIRHRSSNHDFVVRRDLSM